VLAQRQLDDERYKTAMIVIFVLTLFVQILDGTVVNVAIPTLADAFGVTDAEIDRAIIGYLVGLAVFIPTSGWAADRFGARRVFLGSLTAFTVASTLCGLAQTLPQLVLFRILQGVGAGIMGPLGAAMLYRAFPQNERAKAATAVITVAVIAPAIGPVLGGAIVEFLDWRWIFFVNVPIGLFAFVVGLLVIRDFGADTRPRFDVIGFVLAGVGLGATLYGITVARELGWTSTVVVVSLAAGLAGLIALPLYERRREHPLLRFELLRAPIFRSIQILSFPTYAAFLGLIFLLPVYLQSLRGFGALDTGLATFPQAIGVWLSSQLVGRVLYRRIGPRRLLFTGLSWAIVVGVAMAQFDLETSLWTVRLLMFARGFGLGFAFIAIQTAIYAQTSVEDTAQATAMFSANRQAAPAFGVAITAAVLAGVATDAADPGLAAYRAAFWVCALMFVPALIATWWVRDEDAAATMS
jgi:EmrB/QacA subfamily drug resistance transporter